MCSHVFHHLIIHSSMQEQMQRKDERIKELSAACDKIATARDEAAQEYDEVVRAEQEQHEETRQKLADLRKAQGAGEAEKKTAAEAAQLHAEVKRLKSGLTAALAKQSEQETELRAKSRQLDDSAAAYGTMKAQLDLSQSDKTEAIAARDSLKRQAEGAFAARDVLQQQTKHAATATELTALEKRKHAEIREVSKQRLFDLANQQKRLTETQALKRAADDGRDKALKLLAVVEKDLVAALAAKAATGEQCKAAEATATEAREQVKQKVELALAMHVSHTAFVDQQQQQHVAALESKDAEIKKLRVAVEAAKATIAQLMQEKGASSSRLTRPTPLMIDASGRSNSTSGDRGVRSYTVAQLLDVRSNYTSRPEGLPHIFEPNGSPIYVNKADESVADIKVANKTDRKNSKQSEDGEENSEGRTSKSKEPTRKKSSRNESNRKNAYEKGSAPEGSWRSPRVSEISPREPPRVLGKKEPHDPPRDSSRRKKPPPSPSRRSR